MAKAEIKTKENDASVDDFLGRVTDEQQRADSYKVLGMMRRATGDEPKMWGPQIIGFGSMTYRSSATTREVDWMKIGFSPRKGSLSLYVLHHSADQTKHLEKLGKHKAGKGCLNIKRLSDVDEKILERLIRASVK